MIKNKKGSMAQVGTGLTLFIVGAIMLLLTIFVVAELGDTVNTSINDTNNTNLGEIYESSTTIMHAGITVMSISLLIIGAAIVINAARSM